MVPIAQWLRCRTSEHHAGHSVRTKRTPLQVKQILKVWVVVCPAWSFSVSFPLRAQPEASVCPPRLLLEPLIGEGNPKLGMQSSEGASWGWHKWVWQIHELHVAAAKSLARVDLLRLPVPWGRISVPHLWVSRYIQYADVESGTYINTCIHTYIHTYMHTHTHTRIHTHTHNLTPPRQRREVAMPLLALASAASAAAGGRRACKDDCGWLFQR